MKLINEVTIVRGTFKGMKGVIIERKFDTFVVVELYEGSTVGLPIEDTAEIG